MRDSHQLNKYDNIVTEACGWIAQLETGELSPADVDAFREWVKRSPEHAAEINRLARLSSDLNLLSELADPLSKATVDYAPVLKQRKPNKSRWFPSLIGMSGFAATLLVIVAIALMQLRSDETNGLIATPVGGYLEKELEDGTLLKLNTDTQLTIAYDDLHRKIYLHQGEAYFQVAHNAERPFTVVTDTREVLAVGTAFVVRVQEEHINVMVTEGRVAISQNAIEVKNSDITELARDEGIQGSEPVTSAIATAVPISRAPIILQAGETFEDSIRAKVMPVAQVAEEEQQRRLAWQRGLIEFTDTRLEEVVNEVNRYTQLSIQINDDELRNIKFGGIFPTSETQLLFKVLESTYGISITYLDDSTVLLSSATMKTERKRRNE